MGHLIEKSKTLLLAFLPAALASYFGLLSVPFVLLLFCNILDYVTGVLVAPMRGQVRSSSRGFVGIARKIGIWGLVVAGIVVDMLMAYVCEVLQWAAPLPMMVACLVSVWLLANELISIIENIGDLGIQVPFLLPLVRWVRKTAEKAGGKEEEKKE